MFSNYHHRRKLGRLGTGFRFSTARPSVLQCLYLNREEGFSTATPSVHRGTLQESESLQSHGLREAGEDFAVLMTKERARSDSATTVRFIAQKSNAISIIWGDGHESIFHYIWLRDCCQCPSCRHPCSQERLLDTSRLPLDVAAESVVLDRDGNNIEIRWDSSQHGHASVFSAAWLREHCYTRASKRERAEKAAMTKQKLWGASIIHAMPEISYTEVMGGDEGLKRWLDLLRVYGFALMRDVPVVPGQSELLANKIGFPRETFWGTSFDVKAEANPANLSLTGLELKCHTDFSWSEAPPGFQFLHCLKMSENIKGGDSILVDGFRVAQVLKKKDPCAFRILSTVKLPYYFRGENAIYHCKGPVFQLGDDGSVVAVRHNQANRGPLDVDEELVEATYDALKKFSALLSDPAYALRFHLRPGDLLAFNNRRLFHGRGSFSESVERHLEGCYLDAEELLSTHAVVSRRIRDRNSAILSKLLRKPAVESAAGFSSSPSPLSRNRAGHRLLHTRSRVGSSPLHPVADGQRRRLSTFRPDADVSAEIAARYGQRTEVDFVHMKHGTKEDYEFMGVAYELDMKKNMVNRVLNMLEPLKGVKNGAKIDLYEHSLQAATRALKDGADEETVVCALLHDIGELLSPQNHGDVPAGILKPYISSTNHWILANHEVFQGYYYFHFLGGNKHTRDIYKDHPFYERAVDFCEKYDQSSFDPGYASLPLEEFVPMVQRVFARKAYEFDPHNPKMGCVIGHNAGLV